MPVTIKYLDDEATIDKGVWKSENEPLQEMLQAMTDNLVPSASSPSRGQADRSVAEELVEVLGTGAEVTSIDLPDPSEEFEEGVVY